MADPSPDSYDPDARGHWIRLRTLIKLRWIAVAGQLSAITVADRVFEFELPLAFCYLAVGAAVAANLVAIFAFPRNKRLQEAEVVSMLLFDIAQLSFLLYLTGGLNNPFALLVLAPVTIAATALSLRSTVYLGTIALILISLVAIYHVPLRNEDGLVMQTSEDFLFGSWIAIVIGLAFLAGYARRISSEINAMSDALVATQLALAREQKLTDLGGVVAAAAHELGTPLATIKLVSSELVDELDDPDLKEDALLIRTQAERCRDILRSMGRTGKDDKHLKRAPLDTVIREAAAPHEDRGKRILLNVAPAPGGETVQPQIQRKPEIVHGLRNLIQNAVDFAEGTVWIDGAWSRDTVAIRVSDDGEGYPPHVIGLIGDPFLRRRRGEGTRRQGYEGMGLGLFIAKTLLQRTGAELHFSNGTDPFLTTDERPERCGAIVEVTWPLERVAEAPHAATGGLGMNEQIRA